jgi:hypothetical protein
VYAIAYLLRPLATDPIIKRYFIRGLTVKIFGAIALGFIYQFYYNGGDTFNYHTYGSRHIWEAFMDDPAKGWSLLTHTDKNQVGAMRYASKIIFYNDPQSYAVVKLAAIADLFTFSSYLGTSILFSALSFIGVWMMFLCFYQIAPHLYKKLAVAILFIPSVVFWGSGLLKDTVTLGALGVATYYVHQLFILHRVKLIGTVMLFISLYVLYNIKIYIVLVFLPSTIVWILMYHYRLLNSTLLKIALLPIVVIGAVVLGYFAVLKAGEDNPKYSMQALAKTAQITAYDIRYWSGKDAGSGYSLGNLDGTWESMIRLGPQAVNVALFRPYLWESKNILMFLAAIESFALLMLTIYTIYVARLKFFRAFSNPVVTYCMVFSLMFAFSVGVSTYNFGTLMRYKIPFMPYYAVALILIIDYAKRLRNVETFEVTE